MTNLVFLKSSAGESSTQRASLKTAEEHEENNSIS